MQDVLPEVVGLYLLERWRPADLVRGWDLVCKGPYMGEQVYDCVDISDKINSYRLEQTEPERIYQPSQNNVAGFLGFDTGRLDTLYLLQMLQYRGLAGI